MKTRVIQDDPYPSDDGRPSPPGGSPDPGKRGIALRLADWSAANRKKAIWGWLGAVVLLVFIFLASGAVERQTIDRVDEYAGESRDAERALDDAGLRPTEEGVLVQNTEIAADDPAFRALIADIASELSATRYVENVTTPFEGNGGAISEDGQSVLIDFEITGEDDEVADNVVPSEDVVDGFATDNPDYNVEQFGAASSEAALDEIINGDIGRAGMLSLPVTFIVLMVTLGALVAAAVPLLLALTAVVATMAIVVIPSQLIPMSGDVDALILLIGLAVGVDYALFYMRREREERAAGRTPEESLRAAARTSGRAVMISGFTVIIAMSGMLLTGDATFMSFAVATATVVAVMMFAALVVLPAVMSWLGDRVDNGHIPGTKGMRRPAGESRFWSRIVESSMRRPVLSLVLAGGFLLALAIPGIGLQTVQTGTEDLPQDLEVVQTFDRVTEAFPNEAVAAEVAVEADDVRSGPTDEAIKQLVADAEASDTSLAGTELIYSEDGTVASVSIPLPGSGTDEESVAALDEVRDELVPATVGAVEGTTANVTGETAASVDDDKLLNERLPLVFAFVLGLSFLLMLVTFRSIVIPIKAIVLNLLSVFAAYGVLRLVFQEGWGEGVLGFTSNGGITDWLPLFLFVILFGLSMDYHVFILSRVRELYDRGMSTDEAVRRGISGTAGTVTSAALVMVCVFLVFATLSFIDFKELGIGLAAAIFIDATLIRGVLLPASMKVLGDWNWYLPSWLEWLPRIGHGDATPDPDAEAKTAPAAA